MGWYSIENECQFLFDNQVIRNVKKTQRRAIIHIISDEFPQVSRLRISAAVDRSIKRIFEPLPYKNFLSQIKGNLK
jgi:hypothetical protein